MNLAELDKLMGSKVKESTSGVMEALDQAISMATAPQMSQPQPINQWQQARNAMTKISQSIKNERVAQGMTQRDLAAKSGMSQGTITRAERHGWISITCLLRIADALGKEIKLT